MYAGIAARAEQTGHLRRLVASRRRTIAILVLRGDADLIEAGWIDWLESQVGDGQPFRHNVGCLAAAAWARAALGQRDGAVRLLATIAAYPRVGERLGDWQPQLVRSALSVGELDLARPLAGLVAPRRSHGPERRCSRSPPLPRRTASTRPRPPAIAGRATAGTVSAARSQSRRTPGSVTAAAWSRSAGRRTRERPSGRPARSSQESGRPPRSPRPTCCSTGPGRPACSEASSRFEGDELPSRKGVGSDAPCGVFESESPSSAARCSHCPSWWAHQRVRPGRTGTAER